jgi:hypothetical protein
MREPHPLQYVFAFGTLLTSGVLIGLQVWNAADADTPTAPLLAKSLAFAVAPLLSMLVFGLGFCGVVLYLGTFRVGNRVQISGGEHDGKVGLVTKYHGMTNAGDVHLRIEGDGLETTAPSCQVRKIGLRSHIL